MSLAEIRDECSVSAPDGVSLVALREASVDPGCV